MKKIRIGIVYLLLISTLAATDNISSPVTEDISIKKQSLSSTPREIRIPPPDFDKLRTSTRFFETYMHYRGKGYDLLTYTSWGDYSYLLSDVTYISENSSDQLRKARNYWVVGVGSHVLITIAGALQNQFVGYFLGSALLTDFVFGPIIKRHVAKSAENYNNDMYDYLYERQLLDYQLHYRDDNVVLFDHNNKQIPKYPDL